jgi:plastocyanin
MRLKAPMLALPLVLIALAGCGSSSPNSSTAKTTGATPKTSAAASPAPASKSGTVMLIMRGLAFSPMTIHAKVGQTVMWMNKDTATHTIEYVSGPKFKSSGDIAPGQMYSIKLTQAGTINYICAIHTFMHGQIVVSK